MLIYFQSNTSSSLKESRVEKTVKEGITPKEEENQANNVDTASNPDNRGTVAETMEPRDENIEDDNSGDKNGESPVESDKNANCNNAEVTVPDNGTDKNCVNTCVKDDGIKEVTNVGCEVTPEESIVRSASKPTDNLPQESAADVNQNEFDEKARPYDTTKGQCLFSNSR